MADNNAHGKVISESQDQETVEGTAGKQNK
jgi:hypothetical protein